MRTNQKHAPRSCAAYVDQPHADELAEIDRILTDTAELAELVCLDHLRGDIAPDKGRAGMSEMRDIIRGRGRL